MRLLVRSKIWRAFPELDRFSDEQCARFVHAAKGSPARRTVNAAFISGVFILLVAGAAAATAAMFIGSERPRGMLRTTWALMALIAPLCVPPVAAYLLRDWLLRRRIRRVISTRGACAGCGYSLLGLPVPTNLIITCPECAAPTEVDPSLGELAPDASGQQVFSPRESVSAPPRWLTARRLKRLAWWTSGVLAAAALAGAIGWYVWDARLHRQANLALSEMPTVAMAAAVVEGGQPAAREGELDGWLHLDRASTFAVEAQATVSRRPDALKDEYGSLYIAEYSVLTDEPDPEYPERSARLPQEQEMARRALKEFERLGGFGALRGMVHASRAVRDWGSTAHLPAHEASMRHISEARRLTRLCASQMRLAAAAGDWTTYEEMLRSMLRMARMTERQPGLVSRLVSIAIEARACMELRRGLREGVVPTAVLEKVAGALDETDAARLPMAATLESERLFMLSGVCRVFGDAGAMRTAHLNALVGRGNPEPFADGRIGTYMETRDALAAVIRTAVSEADLRVPDRSSMVATAAAGSDLAMVGFVHSMIARTLKSVDMGRLDMAGTRVMVALERHKAAHGRYPDSLTDLVPSYLPEIPTDPWSGKALCYRRIDAAADPEGRGYLLYGVGFDGVDNGGAELPGDYGYETSLQSSMLGKDFIVNTKKRH